MYGFRGYGSSAYGGIIEEKPLKIFNPDVFEIGANVYDPVIFTEELTIDLNIGATLHQPTVTALNKSIVIKVNTVDISNQVIFNSLSVSNNLYSEPNNAYFEIIKSSTKSYVPAPNDEVEIIDTGVTIFKGLLIKISKSMESFVERYNLEFKDWTEELSNTLVDQTYTNYTVEDIITDIFSGLPAYDLTNISDTTVIGQVVSDNIPITNTLDKLAEMTNKYWYVSPNKEIFFFSASDIPAPFNLTDTSGKYDYSSLTIDEDLTQIRNLITIKGKGVAAVTVEDLTSQATYGIKEYYERDEEILATSEATQKAEALLASFKDSIKVVSFRTLSEGLFAGQQITIQSTLRGINETLNIETVNFRAAYQNRFYYEVKATSQRLGRIEDLFKKANNPPDSTPAIQDQGNLQTVEFSAIDDETIQWSAGTIYLADGTSYSIDANASQVLTGDHVIYFDKDTSETELQISTNFADGIGQGKIPLAYATKSAVATKGASIFPVGFGGRMQIDGGTHITEKSIITDNIAANAVTANEISVTNLAAINANLGTCTAGVLKAGSTWLGEISGHNGISLNGTTDYNNIFFKRASDGVVFFRINDGGASSLTYDSSSGNLLITGGTITGPTIQTATTGNRTVIDSNNLRFYSDATQQGFLRPDATNDMVLGLRDDFFITDLAGTPKLKITSVGTILFSSDTPRIEWAGGRYIESDGDSLKVNGVFRSNSDNADPCGTDSRRWNEVHCKTLFEGDSAFTDRYCPICENEFQVGEVIALYIHKKDEDIKVIYSVPAHYDCAKNVKTKSTQEMSRFVKEKDEEMELDRATRLKPILEERDKIKSLARESILTSVK